MTDRILAFRRVRVADGLLESLLPDVLIEWGSPNADGFYEPTFTRIAPAEVKPDTASEGAKE